MMAGPAKANGAAAKTADVAPAAVDVMGKARSDDPGLAVDDVGHEPRLDAIYRKVRRSGVLAGCWMGLARGSGPRAGRGRARRAAQERAGGWLQLQPWEGRGCPAARCRHRRRRRCARWLPFTPPPPPLWCPPGHRRHLRLVCLHQRPVPAGPQQHQLRRHLHDPRAWPQARGVRWASWEGGLAAARLEEVGANVVGCSRASARAPCPSRCQPANPAALPPSRPRFLGAGSSIFFATYILGLVPAALLVPHIGARRMLSVLLVAWGERGLQGGGVGWRRGCRLQGSRRAAATATEPRPPPMRPPATHAPAPQASWPPAWRRSPTRPGSSRSAFCWALWSLARCLRCGGRGWGGGEGREGGGPRCGRACLEAARLCLPDDCCTGGAACSLTL
jgi:hypothetical protein